MISATTYKDIIITLGKFLDEKSGLNSQRILNADSVRGTDISQMINSTESYSPAQSDSFLLFELLEDTSGEHFVTPGQREQDMMSIQSFNFHIMIYGNNSPMDAQKISTIFKNADLVLGLRDSGIFVNQVSAVDPINEFINNTLLIRRDIDIKIEVRFQFDNVGPEPEYFETLTKIEVKGKSSI